MAQDNAASVERASLDLAIALQPGDEAIGTSRLPPSLRSWRHAPVSKEARYSAGGVSFKFGSDIYKRTAELGFWLGEHYWGRGYMKAAVGAALAHLLESYAGPAGRVDKVGAEVLAGNCASDAVLRRCGFQQEAQLRRSAFKHGVSWDLALYALFIDKAGQLCVS